METIDPSTGRPLPPDAIQRVLHITPSTHVYQIPPLTSNKGYVAATWTADNNKRQIFTARLRILETSIPIPATATQPESEKVKADILLEDPANGQLFAAAPYTTPSVVEQVLDSSRFFAIRVEGEGGRKAVLGIGFEERSEAFDFSVALQEVRKTLGIEPGQKAAGARGGKSGGEKEKAAEKKDFSLKEGETITVNIGGKGRRNAPQGNASKPAGGDVDLASFSLPPPPGSGSLGTEGGNTFGGGSSLLPPPPSAKDIKAQKRLSRTSSPMLEPQPQKEESIEDLGFDDGEFGEFQ